MNDTSETDAAWNDFRILPTCRKLERERNAAFKLLKEVESDHKTPDSAFYNECDDMPCHWCEQVRALLAMRNVQGDASAVETPVKPGGFSPSPSPPCAGSSVR